MASDRAVQVRDSLNKIVDELILNTDDQEANVLACCVSLAVEEVEKWMYNGSFTPSVAPYREGKEWKMPCKSLEQEDDKDFTGPPWARKSKNAADEMSAFKRLQERSKNKPVVVRQVSALDRYTPSEWNDEMMRAFRDGNKIGFISSLGGNMSWPYVSFKERLDYESRMEKEYPHLWNAEKKI
jgi:hypothetical protein